jgi:hypothetical protein
MHGLVWPLVFLFALGLTGCAPRPPAGDEGGVLVSVQVDIDGDYLAAYPRKPVQLSLGLGVGLGGGASVGGLGIGMAVEGTRAYLIGERGVGMADAFRYPVSRGTTEFMVPLRPGRPLALTIQVFGDREGWEHLGTLTLPDPLMEGTTVALDVTTSGSELNLQLP